MKSGERFRSPRVQALSSLVRDLSVHAKVDWVNMLTCLLLVIGPMAFDVTEPKRTTRFFECLNAAEDWAEAIQEAKDAMP